MRPVCRSVAAVALFALIAASCGASPSAPTSPEPTRTSSPVVSSPAVTTRPTATSLPAAPTYAMASQIEVPEVPIDLVAADLDQDGNLDLVTNSAESESGIVLLFGRGDGTFTLQTIDVGHMTDVAAEDLDGDGHLDLVGGGEGGRLVIALGAGDRTFGPAAEYTTGGLEAWWLEVADLDRDDVPEVLLTEFMSTSDLHSQRLAVFHGSGGGLVEPAVIYDMPHVLTVMATDLNRDGNMDVLTGSSDSTVGVYLGDGSGILGEPVAYRAGGIVFAIAAGDIDGDGSPDVATGNSNSHSVSFLLGDGAGTLAEATTFRPAGNTHIVLLADLDGDGNLDLLAGGYDETQVRFWRGTGDGQFIETAGIDSSPSITRGVAAADLDNDGKLDLAVTDEARYVSILLQQ